MDKTIKFISLQLTRDYVHLKNSSSWMHFSYNKWMYVESTTKPIGWLSINIAQLTCSSLCVYHTSEIYPICSWPIVVRSQVLWCFNCSFCCCLCVRIQVPWLLCLCSRFFNHGFVTLSRFMWYLGCYCLFVRSQVLYLLLLFFIRTRCFGCYCCHFVRCQLLVGSCWCLFVWSHILWSLLLSLCLLLGYLVYDAVFFSGVWFISLCCFLSVRSQVLWSFLQSIFQSLFRKSILISLCRGVRSFVCCFYLCVWCKVLWSLLQFNLRPC